MDPVQVDNLINHVVYNGMSQASISEAASAPHRQPATAPAPADSSAQRAYRCGLCGGAGHNRQTCALAQAAPRAAAPAAPPAAAQAAPQAAPPAAAQAAPQAAAPTVRDVWNNDEAFAALPQTATLGARAAMLNAGKQRQLDRLEQKLSKLKATVQTEINYIATLAGSNKGLQYIARGFTLARLTMVASDPTMLATFMSELSLNSVTALVTDRRDAAKIALQQTRVFCTCLLTLLDHQVAVFDVEGKIDHILGADEDMSDEAVRRQEEMAKLRAEAVQRAQQRRNMYK